MKTKNIQTMFFLLVLISGLVLFSNHLIISTAMTVPNSSGSLITVDQAPLVKKWNYTIDNALATPAIVDITNDNDFELIMSGVSGIQVFNDAGSLLWSDDQFGTAEASPVTADVDADGKLEVFITTYNGDIAGFNAEDGSILWNTTHGNNAVTGISISDVDHDGSYELLVNADSNDYLLIDALTGTTLWEYESDSSFILFQPAVGDIDNDGLDEFIVGDSSSVTALDTNGFKLWNVSLPNQSGAALADINFDGKLEVVVAGTDGRLLSISNNGTILWSTAMVEGAIYTTPSLGDVDGDGYYEIVTSSSLTNTTLVFNHDGTLLWSYELDGYSTTSATIADIDGDEDPEIVLSDFESNIYGFEGDGTLMWKFTPTEPSANDIGSTIVYDLDLDGDLELIEVEGFLRGYSNIAVYDMGTTGGDIYWLGMTGSTDFHHTMNVVHLDSDSDTLLDTQEVDLGTDPHKLDTDADGIPDGVEVAQGDDPTEPKGDDGDQTTQTNNADTDTSNGEDTSEDGILSSVPGYGLIAALIAVSTVVYVKSRKR